MRARVRAFVLISISLALAGALVVRRDATADDATPAAPEITAAVKALTRDRVFKDAQIGIVVMDCESGAILAESGSHTVLNPASNAKLYTAAAALAMLHGAHRYQTTLSGTIHGSSASTLVLRGQGDPSLRQQDLWAMVQELKMHGVKKIDGDIVVDQSFFDDQTTPPAFEQQPNEWAAFRAPVSAVALDENTVTLIVRPTTSGQPAHVAFSPPGFVDVEGSIKTGDDGADNVGLALEGADHRLHAKISGTIGGDSKLVRYTKRVDDPQLLAGYALRAILDAADVKVSGDVKLGTGVARAQGTVIVRHESEPLSTLLYSLGKSSDNFYAEMIFKSLAAEAKRPGKSADAADIVTKWIAQNDLGDQGVVIKNGSGLFDSNRVTASSVAKLLRWAWQEPTVRNEYVAQLAIGGVDGTLHKRFRDTRRHRAVRAKTGTLDDAIALSGYVLAPNGRHTIAYAILFNKVSGHAASARAAADKLVEIIHDRYYP